jgi:hypothetical protein
MATAKQTSNGSNPKSDWNQGYGFQFWRCRHNAYRGDGAFGQYCVVMPDQDAVVAITSGVKDMQAVLDLIWDKLLPGMESHALRRNRDASQQLTEKLAHLAVPTAQGSAASSATSKSLNRKFTFPANDQKVEAVSLSLSDSGKTLTLTMRLNANDVVIPCGYQEWKKSRAPLMVGKLAQFSDEPTAASFAWPKEDTCVIKFCAYETPFQTTLSLKFDGDQMTLNSEANVAFGPTKRPQLTGHAE